jgi:glycoprotein 6-alpha-L-fucosyltransferase
VSESASPTSRYSEKSFIEFLVDLNILMKADYLVCTFSSNVGRLAYEMRHRLFADAAERTRSVDSIWYYSGLDDHQQVWFGQTTRLV